MYFDFMRSSRHNCTFHPIAPAGGRKHHAYCSRSFNCLVSSYEHGSWHCGSDDDKWRFSNCLGKPSELQNWCWGGQGGHPQQWALAALAVLPATTTEKRPLDAPRLLDLFLLLFQFTSAARALKNMGHRAKSTWVELTKELKVGLFYNGAIESSHGFRGVRRSDWQAKRARWAAHPEGSERCYRNMNV